MRSARSRPRRRPGQDSSSDEQLRALPSTRPDAPVDRGRRRRDAAASQSGRELGYKLTDEQFNERPRQHQEGSEARYGRGFVSSRRSKQENLSLAPTSGGRISSSRSSWTRSARMRADQQDRRLAGRGSADLLRRAQERVHDACRKSRCARFSIAVPAEGPGSLPRSERRGRQRPGRRPPGVRERALAGDSYEKLAADFSDAPSKANAGLIGPISSSTMCRGICGKLFDAMKVGDVTQPLLKAYSELTIRF